MDDSIIASLKLALAATPDNQTLRLTLVKALQQLDRIEEAAELVESLTEKALALDDSLLVAEVFLKDRAFDKGLTVLAANENYQQEAKYQLVKAKLLYEVGRQVDALEAYEKAISINATLEDAALKALLSAKVVTKDNKVKLRVIANDDTDQTEIKRLIQPEAEQISFKDVGGLDDVKKQIHKKIILPYQRPSLFSRFKKKVGGGILLYGPPGCGKTMLARATAGECNAQFYNVVISDILDMYIGESESKLHAVFEQARASSPAVIFFDEVEALAAKRQHSREATSSKLVSQFLAELDGFSQDNGGVLILAATNVPWALDPAFRRPGRFDRIIFVPPPDRTAREDIIRSLLQQRPGGESVDVSQLAKTTSGFSGADLMNLIETAVDEAIDASIEAGEEVPLDNAHIIEAAKIVQSTTTEWLSTARNYAKYANDAGQYTDVLNFLKKYGK